jgi:hypothetical protein
LSIVFARRRFWIELASIALVALVAGTPIVMSALMDRGHEIPKLALAQPMAFLAFGAILFAGNWWASVARQPSARLALICIAAFVVLAALSSAIADLPEMALLGSYYRREGLLVWLSYACVFAAVLGLGRPPEWHIRLLDVLLLASIVPCSYALLQRFDLDFYHVVRREVDRPLGTLGNPLFLASYLGLLLPLTVVRAWISPRRILAIGPWILLGVVQGVTLLLTQSRAPMLAVSLVAVALLSMIGGQIRARRLFVSAAVFLLSICILVTVINVSSSAGNWAQQTPIISRLVYTADRSASDQTQKASGSAATRLSVLEAGAETFATASLAHQLMGFAPDSAYLHYFSHMPDSAMRTEGYWQSNTFDRLHADALDIVLNFGLLGWLAYCLFYCVVFFAAATALFGKSRAGGPWVAFLGVVGSASLGAIAAVWAGIPYAAIPAFGFGIGIGWLLLFIYSAWQSLRSPDRLTSTDGVVRWRLLAGLTSSLLVFWIDAQVNIPVHTTRYLSFAIAALVLILATSLSKGEKARADSSPATSADVTSWGLAFALVATCASLLPSVRFLGGFAAKETERWWIASLPIVLLLMFGAIHRLSSNDRDAKPQGTSRRWIAVVIFPPVLYAALHWLTVVTVGAEFDYGLVARWVVTASLVHVFSLGMCFAYSWHACKKGVAGMDQKIAQGPQRYVSFAMFGLGVLAAGFAWKAIQADVGASFAGLALEKQPEISDRVLQEAIKAAPFERQYQRQRTFSLLGRALKGIANPGARPDDFPRIAQDLDNAERQARESLRQFPQDPWIILALANALQIRALPAIRTFAPAEGRQAALEADELFARAYEIFPNQPLLLRNWAQLRANEGDNWGAYRLLDRMESIIPNEIEPYSERIAVARRLGDSDMIMETIERAKKSLDRRRLEQLLAVAPIQQ